MLLRLELENYLVRKDIPLIVMRSFLTDGYPEHTHDCCELVVILEGTGTQTINHRTFALHPGMVFLINDRDRHAFSRCQRLLLYNVLMDGDDLSQWLAELKGLPGYQYLFRLEPQFSETAEPPLLILEQGDLLLVRRLLETMEGELQHRDEGFELALRGLFLQLTTSIVRCYQRKVNQGSGRLNRIAAALAKMEREFDQPLSVESLARECNLSERQFLRVFQQIEGTSPSDRLSRLRVERACLLLARTDDEMTKIGALVGCSDPNYFSRLFRRVIGMSPREYRASTQKSPSQGASYTGRQGDSDGIPQIR